MLSQAESRIRGLVLVADDSPAILSILCDLLETDHDVIFATSGTEALEMAQSQNPDLILLDVVMPDLSGYEVCTRLQLHPSTKDIPIIFITSLVDEADEAKGLELGAIDYIHKPVHPPIVRARIRNHMELKRSRDALKGLSLMDGLTGITNRRGFDASLESEWQRGVRSRQPLSLLMVDVDHFKLYNDYYGHIRGDECLRKVALTLKVCLQRTGDLVARYGGEEFVSLLPSTDQAGALLVGQRILEELTAQAIPHERSPTASILTLSIGVATLIPTLEQPADLLVESADQALYEAKRSGRNRMLHAWSVLASQAGFEARSDAPSSEEFLSPTQGPSAEKTLPAKPEVVLSELPFVPQSAEDRPRILLIEDDRRLRALFTERLAFLDAHVEACADAAQAISWMDHHRPDLILSDVVMPGMDGFTLCRWAKENASLRAIPFVLLTALSRNLRERSYLAGADDYLSKMEEDAIFHMRLKWLLELGQLRGAAPFSVPLSPGASVMVVSPSHTIRTQMHIQLSSEGIRVETRASMAEAYEEFQRQPCELPILDFALDDGHLVQWIQSCRADHPKLPFVLLASKEDLPRLAGWEQLAQDRLTKPLDAHETRHRVKLLLRLIQARKSG